MPPSPVLRECPPKTRRFRQVNMAEKEKGKETEPEIAPEVEAEQTLTPEEQVEAIKTQLAEAEERAIAAEAKAEEKDKGFRTIQQQLSKKTATPSVATSGTARALQEMIGAIEAQASEEVGGITPATQAKLNAARQQLVAVEQQAVYERQEAITSDFRNNFNAKIEAAGLDPDDDKFDRFWTMVERAEDKLGVPGFEKADKRLDRILETTKPSEEKKAEPKLTPEQEEKIARRWKEKHGELETHEGTPSGASGSFEAARDAMIKNPSNPAVMKRYQEAKKEKGG